MATSTTTVPPPLPARTAAGVRAALAGDDRAAFEHEFRASLVRASDDFDLAPVSAVVEHWWRIAVLLSDGPAHERMLATAAALRAGQQVPLVSWHQVRDRLDA